MPATYTLASQETIDLLEHVRETYHPRLDDEDVKIGIVMAFAAVHPDTGERLGHAIKGYAGAAAGAQVKTVPLRDRVTKQYDVEMLIDGDHWPELSGREKIAMLDHELTHIETTGKVDDLRRPKIKMRDEDFIVWGFLGVVQRHGAAAMEHRSLKSLVDQHGQLLLTLDGCATEATKPVRECRGGGGSVTISSGETSVTLSHEAFSRAAGRMRVSENDSPGREMTTGELMDRVGERMSSTGRQINEHRRKKNAPPVPVNQPTPKEGERPADPDRTNPKSVEGVTIDPPESCAEDQSED